MGASRFLIGSVTHLPPPHDMAKSTALDRISGQPTRGSTRHDGPGTHTGAGSMQSVHPDRPNSQSILRMGRTSIAHSRASGHRAAISVARSGRSQSMIR